MPRREGLRPAMEVGPGAFRNVEQSEDAELRLVLLQLQWVEGETVEGKLQVQPRAAHLGRCGARGCESSEVPSSASVAVAV